MTIRNALSGVSVGFLFLTLFLSGAAIPAAAGDFLVVSNSINPAQAEVRFSEADLLALPQVTIRTKTEFSDGVVEFVGPLARDAVALIDAGTATSVHLVAANDYSINIPLSDFTNYDVILAMQANGKRLSLRDKGPIWLMYPLDDHTELQDPVYNIRLIWQLTVMELR
jgi:hypothetical protein